ncbi:lipoyl synthase [Candidatus Riesia pediculicola]|uniref:Lipoyl synthase n=1 Tax=Riesia pediculicola (strain USDA) TaxID=515618 RepID=D4G7Q1_RIEPU|nr:lipoyl synthase [Candidatus Riesia pediculicola]ADD79445.1 lipoic acid synthetase [Candidatus Riesia pediculicola USDA]ARC53625.1 lipoyl synthase [Candidatus Riesia pediculicola]QOJ86276.1 lipoyl synthase [Candidatus Riesia pediculicola]
MNLKKPSWIKIRAPSSSEEKIIQETRDTIRSHSLHTVCEESSCPNLVECYQKRVVTFLILGSICTRNCRFCNVQKGRPKFVDIEEPQKISNFILKMKLKHIVITSVNRDDLHDKGANHFLKCIQSIRKKSKETTIEILVPDFHLYEKEAIKILSTCPPDIFSHNIESVPRIYKKVRPASDYRRSLNLLRYFKTLNSDTPTKSGIMVGLGETKNEVISVLKDLKKNGVSFLTIGQYLRPSRKHLPVKRYLNLREFSDLRKEAENIGFENVSCGPLVRSSYNSGEIFFKTLT